MSEYLTRRGRAGVAARNRNLTPERRSELARVAAKKRWQDNPVIATISFSAKAPLGAQFCLRKNGRITRRFKNLPEAIENCPGVPVDRHAEQGALRAAQHGRYAKRASK